MAIKVKQKFEYSRTLKTMIDLKNIFYEEKEVQELR